MMEYDGMIIKKEVRGNTISQGVKQVRQIKRYIRLSTGKSCRHKFSGEFDKWYEEIYKHKIKERQINNTQYTYLSYTFSGHIPMRKEIETLLKHTSSGTFYTFLIGEFSKTPSLFSQNILVLKKDMSDNEFSRLVQNPGLIDDGYKSRIVKLMVMRWLNDDYAYYAGDGTIENSVYVAMMSVFPYITSLIFILRINYGSTVFHSLLSLVESEFIYTVVERCNTRTNKHAPFLVGTIHDSFVVEPDKKVYLDYHIKTVALKMFGTSCFVKQKDY